MAPTQEAPGVPDGSKCVALLCCAMRSGALPCQVDRGSSLVAGTWTLTIGPKALGARRSGSGRLVRETARPGGKQNRHLIDAEITMPKVEFEFTADECFVVVDGKRIASRIDGAWVLL